MTRSREDRRRAITSSRARGWRSHRAWSTVAIGAVTVTATTLLLGSIAGLGRPVVVIDGRAIGADAIRFYADEVERAVDDDVRNGRVAPGDRDEELRDRALRLAVEDDALLALAREHDATTIESFDDLVADLERENSNRSTALARGEIVYGSTRFDLSAYRAKLVTDLRSQLERELVAGDAAFTEDALRAEFERSRGDWELAASTYEVRGVVVPFDVSSEAGCADALTGSAAVDIVSVRCTSPLFTERYDGAQPPPQASPQYGRLSAVTDLDQGERSAPLAESSGVSVVELVVKETDAEVAFSAYRDRIAAVLAERRLDDLLHRRLAAGGVDIDAPRLAAVDLEEND